MHNNQRAKSLLGQPFTRTQIIPQQRHQHLRTHRSQHSRHGRLIPCLDINLRPNRTRQPRTARLQRHAICFVVPPVAYGPPDLPLQDGQPLLDLLPRLRGVCPALGPPVESLQLCGCFARGGTGSRWEGRGLYSPHKKASIYNILVRNMCGKGNYYPLACMYICYKSRR